MAELNERFEHDFGFAAVDRLRGERHAVAQRLCHARDQQRRRRVQQHDIAERTLVSPQHRADTTLQDTDPTPPNVTVFTRSTERMFWNARVWYIYVLGT